MTRAGIVHMGIREVSPENRDEFIGIADRAIKSFRDQPGVDSFIVAQDVQDPNRFYVFEEWGDEDGMNELLVSDVTREIGQSVAELCESRVSTFWKSDRIEIPEGHFIAAVKDGVPVFKRR